MLYAIVAVIILILDQGLKYWVAVNVELEAVDRVLIPGVLQLTHIRNQGAAFGLLSRFSYAQWIFLGLTAVFVIVVIVAIATKLIQGRFGRWMALFVLAGAIGNAIDRVIHAYVVDMFEVVPFRFPVFNVADVFITVGGILFCLYVIFHRSEKESVDEKEAAEKAARLAKAKSQNKQGGANIEDVTRVSEGGVEVQERPKQREIQEKKAAEREKRAAERRRREEERRRQEEEAARPAPTTRKSRTETRPQPEPVRDAFSEWEDLPAVEDSAVPYTPASNPAKAAAETSVKRKPAARTEFDEFFETVPEKAEESVPDSGSADLDDSMEFSLEDILNEFR